MSTPSIKRYRAVVEMHAYEFEEAAEELRRDGYDVKALEELPPPGDNQ
jgi:hypothetical protein